MLQVEPGGLLPGPAKAGWGNQLLNLGAKDRGAVNLCLELHASFGFNG